MPITETSRDSQGKETSVSTYTGRVVRVRSYVGHRNHSDTLDYSDFRDTDVTEALVYMGRTTTRGAWVEGEGYVRQTCARPIGERFEWVDCTNLFTWRGSPVRKPEVDVDPSLCSFLCTDHEECTGGTDAFPDKVPGIAADCFVRQYGGMAEDLAAWDVYTAEQARLAKEEVDARAAAERAAAEKAEREAPRKGRTLRVVKGRKVPVGTEGVCIWLGDGNYGSRVGLKDASGTVHWTAATNTIAIDAVPPEAPPARADLGGYPRRSYPRSRRTA